MTFDPKKPVQTREGKPVRIICTDVKNSSGLSLLGLELQTDGSEGVCSRHADGRFFKDKESPRDFINVPVVKWLCCFNDGPGRVYHDDEESATKAGKRSAGFACVVRVELP